MGWSSRRPWRLAVVLEATKDQAKIGLRPGRTPAGVLVKERETGVIPFEEVKWARPKLARGLGGAPVQAAVQRQQQPLQRAGLDRPEVAGVDAHQRFCDRDATDMGRHLGGAYLLDRLPGLGGHSAQIALIGGDTGERWACRVSLPRAA